MSGYIPANYQNYQVPQPKKTGLYLTAGLGTAVAASAVYGVDKYVKSTQASGKETILTKGYSKSKSLLSKGVDYAKAFVAKHPTLEKAVVASKSKLVKVLEYAKNLNPKVKIAAAAALAFIGYQTVKKSGEIDGAYKAQSFLLN